MKNFLKSRKARLGAVITAVVCSPAAVQAADYTTQITGATTEGSTNVTAVIAGVIGIAILGFGVGKMIAWFGR